MIKRQPEREPPLKFSIPEIWQTTQGLAVRGWILTEDGPPDSLEIWLGDEQIPIASWHTRPDIVAKYPQFRSGEKCGFWFYLPAAAHDQINIRVLTAAGVMERAVDIAAKPASSAETVNDGPRLFEKFRREVNEQKLSVLEIGSRVGCPASTSKRHLFPGAREYTGFDYYPGENTDVVGDAHVLSAHFQNRFDALFSVAVLEHLAMPWVAAMEMNKVLNIGGLTYHQTPFTFPLHEQPRDFWRFSDEGLRVLFSKSLGWEVLGCELTKPVRLFPDQGTPDLLHLPSQSGFIHAAILARKIAEIDSEKFRWPVSLGDAPDVSSLYPKPNAGQ